VLKEFPLKCKSVNNFSDRMSTVIVSDLLNGIYDLSALRLVNELDRRLHLCTVLARTDPDLSRFSVLYQYSYSAR